MKEAKMSTTKKVIISLVVVFIIANIIFWLIMFKSCIPITHGDFQCYYVEDTIEITDLSRSGKKKKNIIVPNEINGKKVSCLGETDYLLGGYKGGWRSKNLQKLYLNYDNSVGIAYDLVYKDLCPKLGKIIVVNGREGARPLTDEKIFYFYSEKVLTEYKEDKYSVLEKYPANVTFYLKYEVKEGEREYHWIDDVEDGEKIEVVPEEPKREGYKFGGWYKEQECINKWDFAKDTVEKVKVDRTNYTEFVENKLYAKWMKD